MLGNDVVDLADVDARPETFRRRFEARVFAAQERQAIAEDEDPQACRWAHWGAKEAAYKLARQLDPRFVFSPIKLVACFEPRVLRAKTGAPEAGERDTSAQFERRGRLSLAAGPSTYERTCERTRERTRETTIELRSFETGEFVHVVARPAGADWGAVAMAVESLGGRAEDPGLAVRRLALRRVAHELGVESRRLSIGRRDRIPTVELDGRTTQLALSLSHHGRFVAFAMAPRGRGSERECAERDEGADPGERKQVRGCGEEVTQSTGFVGYPVAVADIEWMAGERT